MSRKEQKDRSESVRNLIIQTTIEIIRESGFEAVSIRNIGKKMGYTSGVIYYHFNDKQEILDAVHEVANKDMMDVIEKAGSEDRGAIENIKAVFFEIMKFAARDRDMFELILLDKYAVRNESINPWLCMIEAELLRGMGKGEIRAMDAKQAAFCIWSAYFGFHYMIGKADGADSEKAEETFNTMAQLLTKGLEA